MIVRRNIRKSFSWAIVITILVALMRVLPIGTNSAYIDPDPLWTPSSTIAIVGVFLFFFIFGLWAFSEEVE